MRLEHEIVGPSRGRSPGRGERSFVVRVLFDHSHTSALSRAQELLGDHRGVIELETTKLSVETHHNKNGTEEHTVFQSFDGMADGRKFHVDRRTRKWKETYDAGMERTGQEDIRAANTGAKRNRDEPEDEIHLEEGQEGEDERPSLLRKRVSSPARPTAAFGDGFSFGEPSSGFSFGRPNVYPVFAP
jgi:hypothetical protein